MPVLPVKGLLPGRGAAGRGASRAATLPVKGLLPGRGPAGRAGRAASSSSAETSVGAADAAAGAGAMGAGSGAAESDRGGTAGASTTASTATAAASSGAGGASLGAAAFLVARLGLASAAGAAGMASFSLRTTGASTVDDAERTNSPSSASLASTTLLSTPSSLASSYTRTFDTTLLSLVRVARYGRASGPSVLDDPAHGWVLIGGSSSDAHLSRLRCFGRVHALDELPQHREIRCGGGSQCAGESLAAFGDLQAAGVQPRSPA